MPSTPNLLQGVSTQGSHSVYIFYQTNDSPPEWECTPNDDTLLRIAAIANAGGYYQGYVGAYYTIVSNVRSSPSVPTRWTDNFSIFWVALDLLDATVAGFSHDDHVWILGTADAYLGDEDS